MNESSAPTSNPLDAIMAEFLLAQERGENPDRQQFLRMHAEQANELAARFDHMDRLAATLAKPNSPDPTVILPNEAQPGMLIAGRYKLIEPIGQGGMGSVWVAEQKEPVKRRVAVKLIKAGMDSREVLARFEAERQALAMMDHTNIARVFDGGMTEQSRPFFVMELVKGIPLTEYCDQVQLTVPERLELFNQVCSAVQHAHQKGIIHRDLKPTNILVTEYDGRPVCKVIDFGLAKALHGNHALTDLSLHTAFGAVVGTPLYMAPEQLGTSALDVDTRADLYSLGVILYELLTGATPIERQRLKQAAWDEVRRIVREEEPPIPSHRLSSSANVPCRSPAGDSAIPPRSDGAQLSNLDITARNRRIEPAKLTKLVRGDLDWIVMKSLEKDRNRRYETANGLSLDIQRYLAGEAVLAAPPSRSYRLRKFIRKHRTPVIAATVLSLSLIAGIIGTSIGFYKANQSAKSERIAKLDAQKKQAEADKARLDAETQRKEAEAQKTRAEAREQEAIDAVRRFGDAVANNAELKNSPSLGPLRNSLLNDAVDFLNALRARLESENSTSPKSLAQLADAAFQIGSLSDEMGKMQDAVHAYEQAIAIYDGLLDRNTSPAELQTALVRSHYNIGHLHRRTGNAEMAKTAFERGLVISERTSLENPTQTNYRSQIAAGYNNLGLLTHNPNEALQAFAKAREIQEQLARENPNETDLQIHLAGTYANIGRVLSAVNRTAAAREAHQRALAIRQQLAHTHPSSTKIQSDLAGSHRNLGLLLHDSSPEEARKAYESALKICMQLTQDHPTVTEFQTDLAMNYNNIGLLLRAKGDTSAALQAYQNALIIHERQTRENPTVTEFQSHLAGAHNNIGLLLGSTGQYEEAHQAYEKALEVRERLARETPSDPGLQSYVGATLNNIAMLDLNSGQYANARDRLRNAIVFQKRALTVNPDHPNYRQLLKNQYSNLFKAANGLTDSALASESRRGLQELAMRAPEARAIEERLVVVTKGGAPHDPRELLTLGKHAYATVRFGLATRFFTDALAQDSKLAEDRQKQIVYNAACCAALAASGQSIGEPEPDDAAKVKLRTQALAGLQEELERWTTFLESASDEQKAVVVTTMKHWQQDADLTSIRDPAELAKLPEAERPAFEALWKSVDELLQKAMTGLSGDAK